MDSYAQFKSNNPFASQAKMLVHIDRVHEYLSTGDTAPVFMEVNPTNRCNLKCDWCICEHSRNASSIQIEPLKRFLRDFAEMGGKAVTLSGGGEPTMYQHFAETVLAAKEVGLEIGLMTNGVFGEPLRPVIGEHFQWVRVSVDTIRESQYKAGKGRNAVQMVMGNVEALHRGYQVKVGVNCNVGDFVTVEDAQGLVEWVEGGAADYLQFRPVLPRWFKPNEKLELNMPVWEYLDSIRGKPFLNLSGDKRTDLEQKNAFPFRSCEGHFFEPILDATGEVKVCMYFPGDKRFTFGNIHESTFPEIWASEQRQRTIAFVRKLNYGKNCQVCCKLTEPNKLLDFLLHTEDVPDKNFL